MSAQIRNTLIGIILTGSIPFTLWALDTRYVTISDLKQFALDQDRAQIERQARELRLKKRLNLADEYEKALLEELEKELNGN